MSDLADRLRSMTLREKVGQLFVPSVHGATAHTTDPVAVRQNQALLRVANAAEAIERYHLGGVIFFGYAGNLVEPTQIARLSNDLQTVATSTGARIPLMLSTDQEGGNVTRIGAPLAVSPGNLALGAGFDPAAAYAMSRVTGQQLRPLGINVDHAPAVDTNTNPNSAAVGARAFGDRAFHTAAFGAASVRGYQSARIAATAKHFPGLGSTTVNTDFGVATSGQTRAEFDAHDLPAFRAAVAAGVDVVMAAHVVAPGLDPTGMPASLSPAIITGILRTELGFDGVVVSDALDARALDGFDPATRCIEAIRAGVDQLLVPTDLAGSFEAVIAAVRTGVIPTARIDESVGRLLRLKLKLGLFARSQVDVSGLASRLGTPDHLRVQDAAARRAITLLRNPGALLPIPSGPGASVLVTGYGEVATDTLAAGLRARGVPTSRLVTGVAPSAELVQQCLAAAATADCVVDVSYHGWAHLGQVALARRLAATGKPLVVVAVGAPYELALLPPEAAVVAAYGFQSPSMVAAADVLFGAQPQGRLPLIITSSDGSSVVAAWGSGLRYA